MTGWSMVVEGEILVWIRIQNGSFIDKQLPPVVPVTSHVGGLPDRES